MLTIVKPGYELMTPRSVIESFVPLLEAAGRTCYKTEDKITADSAAPFIRSIIARGHESVIEHCAVTVRIICSRSCSHQLVRHRIAAFSQESQRYCDYGKKGLVVICPPTVAKLEPGTYERDIYGSWFRGEETRSVGAEGGEWLHVIQTCYDLYLSLRKDGVPPEDARSVLPNATKTEVATTFNLRQWRHVFEHRALNPKAQWEIRQIMCRILSDFADRMPAIFGDLLAVDDGEEKP